MIILKVFSQNIAQVTSSGTFASHAAEIIIMLLVAFLLGYLVRHFLNIKFKNRIKELEAEVVKLKGIISNLEEKNAQLNADLDAAVERTIHLGNDILVLEGKLKTSENINTKLNSDLHASLAKINIHEEEAKKMQTKFSALDTDHKKIKTELEESLASAKEMAAKLKSFEKDTAAGQKKNN